MITAILTRCLNTTDVNNYCAGADGQRYCIGTVVKGLVHLAPLDTFSGDMVGPNPRLATGRAPTPFYFCALRISNGDARVIQNGLAGSRRGREIFCVAISNGGNIE